MDKDTHEKADAIINILLDVKYAWFLTNTGDRWHLAKLKDIVNFYHVSIDEMTSNDKWRLANNNVFFGPQEWNNNTPRYPFVTECGVRYAKAKHQYMHISYNNTHEIWRVRCDDHLMIDVCRRCYKMNKKLSHMYGFKIRDPQQNISTWKRRNRWGSPDRVDKELYNLTDI